MITAPLLALGFFTRPQRPHTLAERCAALGTDAGPIVGDVCHILWDDAQPHMHPTQPGIGYAWAMRKLHKDMDAHKSLEDSQAAAQETMDEKGIPTVKYGSDYYFIDGHHTQSALDALHGVHPGIKVYVDITIILRPLRPRRG